MEDVCYLKAIDNLVRSAMTPAVSGLPSISLNTCNIEKAKADLKRVSPEKICDYIEHSSPVKQHRSDCFDEERHHFDIELVIPEERVANVRDQWVANSAQETLSTTALNKAQKINFEITRGQKFKGFLLDQQAHGHLDGIISTRMAHDGNIRSLSVPRFEESLNLPSEECKSKMQTKETMAPHEGEVKIKRCRSLPCRSNYDSLQNERFSNFLNKRCQSPIMKRLDSSFNETLDNKNKQYSHRHNKSDICHSDNECLSDHNSCDSRSATPSSCYIDVEADRSPCSPLNLTTNDNEFQQNNENIPNDADNSLTDISYLNKQDNSSFNSNQNIVETVSSIVENLGNEKSHEKKTNFSIDAILRPDFGAVRASSEVSAPFKICNVTSINPRLRNTIKSYHSAFTAVDLSTRSRSDSLSSPSCSSSSPSPPLSTCSTSPRLKPDFSSSDKNIVHDNLMFSSRIFPDPNVEFHNLFKGHIPFINPIHPNGFGNFPFVYSSQECFQNKIALDRDSIRHQHSQQNSRAKSDHLKNDISKYLSRTLCPFISSTPSCRPDVLKQTRIHDNEIKTGNSTALHPFRQNKPSKSSFDSALPVKTAKSPAHNANDTKNGSRVQSKSPISDNNASANCKVEFKQEKQNEKSEDFKSKGEKGSQMWPAWVFCTRYSDRPSSGPRSRKPKRSKTQDEKRPRTAFTNDQLVRLKREFEDCRYLTEARRKSLAEELGLTESQIKIWFQNKRAKIKKSVGARNPLALQLMEQGLYNHSTIKLSDDSN